MKFTRRRSYSFDPLPKVDQDEQRRRRRAWLPNVLGAEFDLTAEVEAITAPLAARVAADPVPRVLAGNVADLADAVAACLNELNTLVGADGDGARIRHLSSEEDRQRALQLLRSRRAATAPQFDAAALGAGTWAVALVEMTGRSSEPLSRFLGRSRPDSIPTATEVVEASLRGIDRAALSLDRRLDRRAADREQFASTRTPAPTVEAELESLGVTL
ncbi:hypothetical protein CH272_08265 [Rhodococcus sp. 05-340-1]|uniref:hypothetical protein n=1 Tax=unclassified Rhodococcus (in: high G+C Gram-positive bacteria) TaxID=192944 RepID=UPI000B9C0701|nr:MULTISPECIES: hypothetical protein [unclassified Rhodococcus (in: high G+C Gram-positive bacteria)]OZD66689.1 hypothetical protein CH271_17430 [Rhodococcus sp. 05-340-2]OZD80766.1 hypothetical protein CH272_08265 [Rhodococcus sp. 05-340-1]